MGKEQPKLVVKLSYPALILIVVAVGAIAYPALTTLGVGQSVPYWTLGICFVVAIGLFLYKEYLDAPIRDDLGDDF